MLLTCISCASQCNWIHGPRSSIWHCRRASKMTKGWMENPVEMKTFPSLENRSNLCVCKDRWGWHFIRTSQLIWDRFLETSIKKTLNSHKGTSVQLKQLQFICCQVLPFYRYPDLLKLIQTWWIFQKNHSSQWWEQRYVTELWATTLITVLSGML